MEFQWSYFKSWKLMLWKCCTQQANKFGKLSRGHRTGKGQFSFQSQRKAMSNNAQTITKLQSSQNSSYSSTFRKIRSRPPIHHFMAKRWGNSGNSDRFYFGGSKITADGDCSHEIKRCLLLGRKAMTNLGSRLKSRDITLPTTVHLVKAMVFPVVMYGYESWTIKKGERRSIDAFELWCWRRLLRVPWTARRSNQSILKEISPEYSLEGLVLKLKRQDFGHLMWRADSLEKTLMLERLKAGGEGDDRGWDGRMASPTQLSWVWASSESWWWTGGKAWRAAVHGFAKSQIQLSEWTELKCLMKM